MAVHHLDSHTPASSGVAIPLHHAIIHRVNRGLITRLVRKGLIVKIDRGQYDLYHPMFRNFVQRIATEFSF